MKNDIYIFIIYNVYNLYNIYKININRKGVCGLPHPLRPEGLPHPGDRRAHLGLLDILIGGGEGLVGGREDDHAGPPLGTAAALGHEKN